ncbi:MAG: hypothetical protein IPG97_07300 [Microthrixaceae bacterium]|nr:hypothetical protein [Microthrixaceae bacterium]
MITRGPRSIIAAGLACMALLFGTVGCSSDDDATDRSTTTVAGADQGGTATTNPGDKTERGLPAERDRQDSPAAAVVGALTGGTGTALTDIRDFDLEGNGFVQEEYAVEGTATSYVIDDAATDLPGSGEFNLSEGDTADYRTRVVVRRPAKAEDFNGTVVLEWLNVSGGIDANPDWTYLADEIIRGGYAWVGVSAQHIGVEGGPVAVSVGAAGDLAGKGLKAMVPERYGELSHPGDAYSFDIYTQVSRTLRQSGADGLLGGLEPEAMIAAGESQSAFALTTYANGVQPHTQEFDAFFIHSRGGGAQGLGGSGGGVDIASAIGTQPTQIREDVGVPVLMLQTESDVVGLLNYFPARQDDTDTIRLWEVAGTAHVDRYMLGPIADTMDCGAPINDGPMHWAAKAGPATSTHGPAAATPPQGPPLRGRRLGGGARLRAGRERHRRGWDPHPGGGRAGADPLRGGHARRVGGVPADGFDPRGSRRHAHRLVSDRGRLPEGL